MATAEREASGIGAIPLTVRLSISMGWGAQSTRIALPALSLTAGGMVIGGDRLRKQIMAEPYYQDNLRVVYNKDCRDMSELPSECIQMVCTSPPYWDLRKYSGVPDLVWGDNHCEHEWGEPMPSAGYRSSDNHKSQFCSLCGAWKGQYGLEPTPELYIQHTIEILREIRRVLRKDGVVFWNIGDSYASSGQGWSKQPCKQSTNKGAYLSYDERYLYEKPPGYISSKQANGIKPKDLCLIPFRVAIAAQEDGWWVRSVIIWSKPNPMPESVTDRPTESHEYILMLTKSKNYYWDQEAVREPISESYANDRRPHGVLRQRFYPNSKYVKAGMMEASEGLFPTGERDTGRNIRSVWTFPTEPYPEAHFATFPEKLPEICIKAATPEVGCCAKCGKPWGRVIENKPMKIRRTEWGDRAGNRTASSGTMLEPPESITVGWQPTCKCNTIKPPVPSLVLDPFAGSGTTLKVAAELGRRAVGYEISEEYCRLIVERNRQQVMELRC